jgi:hypothetical protein
MLAALMMFSAFGGGTSRASMTPLPWPGLDIDGDPRTPPIDCGADHFGP